MSKAENADESERLPKESGVVLLAAVFLLGSNPTQAADFQ
jgi:hypothetical protein